MDSQPFADLMPLDDVRIIDLTHLTAGPFCTRILADYGADVIKVEPPDGDPARQLPPFADDRPGVERSGLFLFLNTNKRSVILDLRTAAGRDTFLRLVASADVVVENFRPGTMESLGIGYETLRAINPRLVLTSITNFGQDGPYRDYLGTDLTLYAMGGAMSSSGEAEHEPLKTAGRMVSYHAGYVGALATAVALVAARQRGTGEHVDVSIFEAAVQSIDLRLSKLLGYEYTGRVTSRPTLVAAVGTGVFPCADGFFLLTGGPAFMPRLIRMIEHEELLALPAWSTPTALADPARIDEFTAYLLPWTLQHTRAEIRDACEQHGVLGGPINTVADLLVDPNFTERRFFQQIEHPEAGTLTYPGYHFTLHRAGAPMPPRRRAPLLGEHTTEVLAALDSESARVVPPPQADDPAPTVRQARHSALPLAGMRILDLSVVWAGPYATMQLADWGAEVIRVESLQHMAPSTRGQLARPPQALVTQLGMNGTGYPDDDAGARSWNRSATFNAHARGKKSMTVDLTRPEGRAVFDRLLAMSDGVIENNLPINMEKQGLTWERLSAVNPRLVLLRIPGFGITGTYRGYRTMGHHMEALAGHPAIRSYPDLSLEYAPVGVPSDAASGIGSAFAFLMGMRYRERTGRGLQVELATAENFVPLMGEFVMDYTMNGRLWDQMGNDHFWLAPHNVYRCHGADHWVTIAVRSDGEWSALCAAMHRDDLRIDPRFATMSQRHANRRALDVIISEWTGQRDAYWIMRRLQRAGVAAGVVISEADAHRDPHLAVRGFFREIAHPETGVQSHVGRAWRASETPDPLPRHPVLLGEDNEYVYRELLGFSAAEYEQFEALGHIGMDYDPAIL